MDATPESIHPIKILEELKPLTKGQYPVFNKYPKFIVDYQVKLIIFENFQEFSSIEYSVLNVDLCITFFAEVINCAKKIFTIDIHGKACHVFHNTAVKFSAFFTTTCLKPAH